MRNIDVPAPLKMLADDPDVKNGNASHWYLIKWNPKDFGFPSSQSIRFQHGPVKEHGINGITNEALLAIVIDRLEGFQSGPFACEENGQALSWAKLALGVLEERTKNRIDRGVEGTNVK